MSTAAAVCRPACPFVLGYRSTLDLLLWLQALFEIPGTILAANRSSAPFRPLSDVLPGGPDSGKVNLSDFYVSNVFHFSVVLDATWKAEIASGQKKAPANVEEFWGTMLRRVETRALQQWAPFVCWDCELYRLGPDGKRLPNPTKPYLLSRIYSVATRI